jgi:hypothetical protein
MPHNFFANYDPADVGFQWFGLDAEGDRMPQRVYVYIIEFTYLHESKWFTGHLNFWDDQQ